MRLLRTFSRLWNHLDRRGDLRPHRRSRRPLLELLEDRTMPSVSLGGIPGWVPEGPAPQKSAGNVIAATPETQLDVGAVEALAVDPMNSQHVLAGTVNGGVWQTADFTAPTPIWTTTTDLMPSLSINSVAFSPVSSNVIYAGTGQVSSDGAGGPAVGVYKSIDGGATWQIQNPGGMFSGLRILRIIPTTLNGGQTVFLATTDTNGPGTGGVYRSDDGGGNWKRLSGGTSGLPDAGVTDLVENPNNANQFFAATSNSAAGASAGVYELDLGVDPTNWTNVTNNIAAGDLTPSLRIELAISPAGANPVWLSIINTTGFYQRVYRGVASGATFNWTQVGPTSGGVNQPPDILSGNHQGGTHGAILADPTADNLVYLSGDATNQGSRAGYIVRGDSNATTAAGFWTALVPIGKAGDTGTVVPTSNGDTTAPHADSRAMVFGAGGVILYACDGGVYQGTNPRSTTSGDQTWSFVGGATTATTTGIQDSEMYSIAYDSFFNIILGGDQDTGNPSQTAPGSFLYTDESGGDGGATATDPYTLASKGQAARIIFSAVRKLYDGPSHRVSGDHDASILPQAGLSGLTSGLPMTNPNDLFVGSVVNAIGPTPAQVAANKATRVVVGGKASGSNSGAVYESDDVASSTETQIGTGWFVNDTWTQVPVETGTGFNGVNQITANAASDAVMAYGGRLAGLDNPDVLYVASGSKIFLRTKAGDMLKATAALPAGTGFITAIALDPNNWATAVVTDNSNVIMTTDAGKSWVSLTGLSNNPVLNARLAVIPGAGQDAILFGGGNGVYRMLTSAPGVWTRFGAGLPNAPVGGMVYNTDDDVLVVGSHGRGAWEVPNASVLAFTPGVLEIDGDTDFAGQNDTIKLMLDAGNPALLDVYLNSATPVDQVPIALLNQINVNGLGGNDTLIVDSSNGLVSVPNGINYDGGTGFNSLQLIQTGGPTQTSDTYSVGPGTGMGTSTIVGPGGTQVVFFQNLAPVTDTVPATTLTVNATPGDNAINYTVGSVVANGKVTVDSFEPIEFSNKDNLAINSLAGTDTVSLNNPNKPTGATAGGLKRITVTGGDPTSFDTLIVNGTGAVAVATATKTVTGAGPVSITYATIESLVVNAGGNNLAVSGSTSYAYTPGTAADAGSVQTDTVPVSFTGVGGGKTLALTGSGGGASLVVNGTTGDDTFAVSATGTVTLGGRATIAPASIPNLTLNGLDGSDTVSLTGNGGDLTAGLGGATAGVSGAGLGGGVTGVSLSAVEVLNLNAGAGNITLAGTGGSDAFTVTPTGANTATAQVGSLAPVVNTTNTGALAVDAGAGSDTLAVNGTGGADTINVDGTSVSVVGLKSIGYSNVEALQVNGLAGSDTFNVTSSATVPISIDGGDPVGVLPGDLLNVVTNLGDLVTFTPGPTSDSGGFQVNANQPISFVHIESLSVSGGGTPVINGTNGNDVITIIARDGSYVPSPPPGLDGVQDFTVSVNAGPNFLFINTPSLIVHALAGDDQIVLQAPAPNLAAWNVAVAVDGGPSSAVGDQFVMSAPGTDQAAYTPTSANSGTLAVINPGVVTNVAMTDIESFIYDGQAGGDTFTMVGTGAANAFALKPGAANDAGTLAMDSTLPVSFQNLGTAGQVVVNGNGGADALTYYGTPVNDSFTVSSSQVSLNARVPLLTTGIPTLTLEGVAGNDTFTLTPTIANSPYTTLNLHAGPPATPAGSVANLKATAGTVPLAVSGQVVTQGGVTVAGSGLANINLDGAGNQLTYNGVPGVTEAITISASPTANQGQISVPGEVLVSFVNVPALAANGNPADNDTLTFAGTNNDDTFQVRLAALGTAADPVLKLQNAAASLLLTLTNYTGFVRLGMNGLDGSDTFNVHVAAVGPGRHIFIDGGLDTGKKKGTDVLNFFYATPRPKIVHSAATQNPTSGLISADYGTAFFLVEYAGIENVTIHQE